MEKHRKTESVDKPFTGRELPTSVTPILKAQTTAFRPKSSSQAAAAILTAFFTKKHRHKLTMLIILSLLAAIVGCGSSPDPNRLLVFPTKGQIAFKGKSPGGAFVVLHPKAATGPNVVRPHAHVHDDGTFSLSTYNTNDGAPAGEYKVTVELHNLIKRSNGDIAPGPNVLPKQYSRPETSPLIVRIAEGENSLSPIVLK